MITGEMLGLQGEEEEQLMATASNAFCRALDREDEYDATDALASQSLRPDQMPERPPLETEVRRYCKVDICVALCLSPLLWAAWLF